MTNEFVKSTRTTFIDHINAVRAQLNQLERLINEHMPNENNTLYKWDMIPAGYDYAACDHNAIYAYKEKPRFIGLKWLSFEDNQPVEVWRNLPLTVLNRLPGEPSTTLEKRPGAE